VERIDRACPAHTSLTWFFLSIVFSGSATSVGLAGGTVLGLLRGLRIVGFGLFNTLLKISAWLSLA